MELSLIVTAASEAALAATLVHAGILKPIEGALIAADNCIYSPIAPSVDGRAHAFVRITSNDQDALDAISARIPLDMLNQAGAPLRMVSGSLQPKPESWPTYAVELALVRLSRLADWEGAITTLSTKVDAIDAEKMIPVRWKRDTALTLEEPWVTRVINKMRMTLGWTVAERNQFLNQLKVRATGQI